MNQQLGISSSTIFISAVNGGLNLIFCVCQTFQICLLVKKRKYFSSPLKSRNIRNVYSCLSLIMETIKENMNPFEAHDASYLFNMTTGKIAWKNGSDLLQNLAKIYKEKEKNSFWNAFIIPLHSTKRSSHQRCSVKKIVLRSFTKFTGKCICQSLFFNKVAGPRPETLSKKRLWRRCFPVNFGIFLRSPFLQNTSGRPLLN